MLSCSLKATWSHLPPPPSMRTHVNTNLYGPQHTFAYTETTMGFVFISWLLIHTLAHVARQTTWPSKHTADETTASLAVFVDTSFVWDITFTSGWIFFFNGETVQITHRSCHKGNKTHHDLLFKCITTNERRSVLPRPYSGVGNTKSHEKRSPGLIVPP